MSYRARFSYNKELFVVGIINDNVFLFDWDPVEEDEGDILAHGAWDIANGMILRPQWDAVGPSRLDTGLLSAATKAARCLPGATRQSSPALSKLSQEIFG